MTTNELNIGTEMQRYAVEGKEKWRELATDIPELQFPSDWKIRIIPPFGGATVRFTVDYDLAHVSIYLDHYSRLGCMDYPYWEIYPAVGGDTDRFKMQDTEELLKAIEESLAYQIAKAEEEIPF